MLLQGVATYSQSDSAAMPKSNILQCEEGQEEVCQLCERQVHEAALWPLDQTQGVCKAQVFYCFTVLLHLLKTQRFQCSFSPLKRSLLNRLDTRKNCGRSCPPDESAWGSMCSVTKHRASFWIKWQPLFGKGGTGIWMIHTWSTTIGSTSKCKLLIHVVT